MDKVILRYIPDAKETLCFKDGPVSMEECFEAIKHLCTIFQEDLKWAEFLVDTEDGKPMFNLSGCIPAYFIKEDFKYLEPAIKEVFDQYVATRPE